MSILHLPQDLYSCIQEYTNINPLLNTTKKLSDVKYELHYWKLNKEYSLKYYDCGEFRNRINSIMYRTLKQLSLNLNALNAIDVSALGNIHSLCYYASIHITDESMFENTIFAYKCVGTMFERILFIK